jgi:segregation and condensation protein A
MHETGDNADRAKAAGQRAGEGADDGTDAAARIAAWEAPSGEDLPEGDDALIVDVAGFEGPLDLLLALARTQKVDLARISMLALVDQYLTFIAEAHRLRIEVAADYLVMAAWLTLLKSRLLLPREDDSEEVLTAEEMARRLSVRLMRLDAMRQAAAQLMTRKRLGRDVFARGMPETVRTVRETSYTATIFDLLKAYAEQRRRTIPVRHIVRARRVWSIKDARQRLERLIGEIPGDWLQLDLFLDRIAPTPEQERTARASAFGASLEMAREGLIDIQQDQAFAPLYLRRRARLAAVEQNG